MRAISIRELKTHLSKVLRDVQNADVVLITDRCRVVAELRRPDASRWVESAQERALARLAACGELRIAERPATAYQRSPVNSRAGLARRLLDADRSNS